MMHDHARSARTIEQLVATLRRTRLFALLDEAAAVQALDSVSQVRLEDGDVLFREQDVGQSLFIVASGRVKLGCASASGREMLVALLGSGEMFGELSVVDESPRTMTATAVGDTVLLELSASRLGRLYETHPQLQPAMLQALARRVRDANEMLADLVFRDTAARVAKVLLELSARHGREAKGGVVIVTHGMTQLDLAHLVGSTRETVNRVLAEFTVRGWIRLEDKSVHLTDTTRLSRRAGLHQTPIGDGLPAQGHAVTQTTVSHGTSLRAVLSAV